MLNCAKFELDIQHFYLFLFVNPTKIQKMKKNSFHRNYLRKYGNLTWRTVWPWNLYLDGSKLQLLSNICKSSVQHMCIHVHSTHLCTRAAREYTYVCNFCFLLPWEPEKLPLVMGPLLLINYMKFSSKFFENWRFFTGFQKIPFYA